VMTDAPVSSYPSGTAIRRYSQITSGSIAVVYASSFTLASVGMATTLATIAGSSFPAAM